MVSGLGEDTFWTWFIREFPSSSFDEPSRLDDDDVLLRYSTLGFLPVAGKQVALCWELYPEMRELFGSTFWDERLAAVYETARYATYRVVPSTETSQYYERFGTVTPIPIGVDTERFAPIPDKEALRSKFGLPENREIGVWAGTSHPMKGFARVVEYARAHPEVHWVIVSKSEEEAVRLPGATNLVRVDQLTLSQLINCGDFFLATNLLTPFSMVEWEAMACDASLRIIGENRREFLPSPHPRDDVLRLGWDRPAAKNAWERFLGEHGVSW